jgi:hypothetical protein
LGDNTSQLPVLWCDNLGAIFLAANLVFHAHTKHIDLDFHFVREKLADKKLAVKFMCSTDQIADVFTKSLAKIHFHTLSHKLTISEKPLYLKGVVEYNRLDNSSVDKTGQVQTK